MCPKTSWSGSVLVTHWASAWGATHHDPWWDRQSWTSFFCGEDVGRAGLEKPPGGQRTIQTLKQVGLLGGGIRQEISWLGRQEQGCPSQSLAPNPSFATSLDARADDALTLCLSLSSEKAVRLKCSWTPSGCCGGEWDNSLKVQACSACSARSGPASADSYSEWRGTVWLCTWPGTIRPTCCASSVCPAVFGEMKGGQLPHSLSSRCLIHPHDIPPVVVSASFEFKHSTTGRAVSVKRRVCTWDLGVGVAAVISSVHMTAASTCQIVLGICLLVHLYKTLKCVYKRFV